MNHALFALVTLTAATCMAAEQPTLQDVFYMNNGRLIVLRFDIRVAGQPLEAAWLDFARAYFAQRDQAADGAIAGDELARLPTASEIRQLLGLRQSETVPTSADFRPRDGKVTLSEWTAWLRQVGAGPLNIQGTGANANSTASVEFDLFAELDEDSDKTLSLAEAKRRAAYLKKLDIDEDESLSPDELRPQQAAASPGQPRTASGPMLLAAASATERRELVNFLLRQFDGKGRRPSQPNAKLSGDELTVSAETFASADLDNDGQLDYEELGQFIRRPRPTAALGVDLDSSAAKRLSVDPDSTGAKLTERRGGRYTISIGEAELELNIQPLVEADASSQRDNFASADSDSNGYLEREETERAPPLRGLHRLLDAKVDGKVYFDEFATFSLDAWRLNSRCMQFAGKHRGTNLLQIFDTNDDGRLGFRELDDGVERLEQWDADKSQGVLLSELPCNGLLTIAPATLVPRPRETDTETASLVPAWFTRMDKNSNGEVSLREFLGPLLHFKKHDGNGDLVISTLEASTAD